MNETARGIMRPLPCNNGFPCYPPARHGNSFPDLADILQQGRRWQSIVPGLAMLRPLLCIDSVKAPVVMSLRNVTDFHP
jgi:hypothetical protein